MARLERTERAEAEAEAETLESRTARNLAEAGAELDSMVAEADAAIRTATANASHRLADMRTAADGIREAAAELRAIVSRTARRADGPAEGRAAWAAMVMAAVSVASANARTYWESVAE